MAQDRGDIFDVDEHERSLRQWLYPDGYNLDSGRASKLRDWLRDLGIREVSLTFALRCAGLADLRFNLAARIAHEPENSGGI